MNLKLIFIILLVLLLPLMDIVAFSLMSTIQPTIAGYSITDLMRFCIYPNAIIYITTVLLLIFKYKIVLDSRTALTILVLGFILLPLVFIPLKGGLVPSTTPLGLGGTLNTGHDTIFQNQIMISAFYLSFVFSIYLSQFSSKPLFKVLIFIFTGLVLGFIFSYLENFVYSWLA